jgi:hypothetical protein
MFTIQEDENGRLKEFLKPRPAEPMSLLPILFTLERIEVLLAARMSAVLDRDAAAKYLGVAPETLDHLAASNPQLRPVSPSAGYVVWRRADLDRFLQSLTQ